ncbi:flagellar assembly protein FliH [Citrobacter portucalensis]|uniref:flagellar assembly protein FliH n=1 Tax=Citrobacter portucalensis TaxID=1639133 RepID=UPI003CEFC4E5
MFKKRSLSLGALTPCRQVGVKPRLHHFPPLRKRWQPGDAQPLDKSLNTFDSVQIQQQLKDGFQEGFNRGFAKGVEDGKKDGYQDGAHLGFEDGMRKGMSEGKQLARQQFLEAAEPFDRITDELRHYLDGYEERRREELLKLVEKVTRQVIRCELTLHPTQLLTLVEEALSSLPQPPEQVRVQLNAEEFRRISEVEPEKAQQWGLMAVPALAPGECRVITESTEMDVGCQHRLDQCVSVLKETLLPGEQHELA